MTKDQSSKGKQKSGRGASALCYAYAAADNLGSMTKPFHEDFDDGDYSGWGVAAGSWDASGGVLTKDTSPAGIIYRTVDMGDDAAVWRGPRGGWSAPGFPSVRSCCPNRFWDSL